MQQPATDFEGYEPSRPYLVGIDSDGCAFDTMELKHKECFIPNMIYVWGLQAVSKYARQAAEFVNLYSKWRGINRFPALVKTFDLLRQRPEVLRRGVSIPEVPNLRQWVEQTTRLDNQSLTQELERTGHQDLALALEWSKLVNETVARMVRGVPPFPYVRETLERLADVADVVVVSATPTEALLREWHEHGISRYVRVIAGQEAGSKQEMLQRLADCYEPSRRLMIGDAPGDRRAAQATDTLFYPVCPGQEEASWQRFCEEALDRFLTGTYGGSYEQALLEQFDRCLLEQPPWGP